MKIAIIVENFPPQTIGGTELASYQVSKYLSKRGNDVHVITTIDHDLDLPKKNSIENFSVYRVKVPNIKFLRGLTFYFKAFFILRTLESDLIQCQSIIAGLSGLLSGKPYFVWVRGSDINIEGIYFPRFIEMMIYKLIINNANCVFALTKHMKKEIENKFKRKKVCVIPNGIEIEKFKNIKNKIEFQNNQDKVILFVGSLRPVKGVKYLIMALEKVIKIYPNVKLIIIGHGDEYSKLLNLVKQLNLNDYVKFEGEISNDRVLEYMSSSDLFVLPSLSEGFPNVILEAMAEGLPIISTNVKGLDEMVKNNINGLLVKPKDPQDIAKKILKLINDENLRKKMSKNNINESTNYSWEKVIQKLENIYLKY